MFPEYPNTCAVLIFFSEIWTNDTTLPNTVVCDNFLVTLISFRIYMMILGRVMSVGAKCRVIKRKITVRFFF